LLINPWVKIWRNAYTKKIFIKLIDTLREGERVKRLSLQGYKHLFIDPSKRDYKKNNLFGFIFL
jgi:hypothetical protein